MSTIPANETPAERELRLAWKAARKARRLYGTPYNEFPRLIAATDRACLQHAETHLAQMREIDAICDEQARAAALDRMFA